MFNKPIRELTLKDATILYVGYIFVNAAANVFLLPPLRKLEKQLENKKRLRQENERKAHEWREKNLANKSKVINGGKTTKTD
jgi:hypothetical protein